jgi:hypothetical protein
MAWGADGLQNSQVARGRKTRFLRSLGALLDKKERHAERSRSISTAKEIQLAGLAAR